MSIPNFVYKVQKSLVGIGLCYKCPSTLVQTASRWARTKCRQQWLQKQHNSFKIQAYILILVICIEPWKANRLSHKYKQIFVKGYFLTSSCITSVHYGCEDMANVVSRCWQVNKQLLCQWDTIQYLMEMGISNLPPGYRCLAYYIQLIQLVSILLSGT
jgi:hypothetical protein